MPMIAYKIPGPTLAHHGPISSSCIRICVSIPGLSPRELEAGKNLPESHVCVCVCCGKIVKNNVTNQMVHFKAIPGNTPVFTQTNQNKSTFIQGSISPAPAETPTFQQAHLDIPHHLRWRSKGGTIPRSLTSLRHGPGVCCVQSFALEPPGHQIFTRVRPKHVVMSSNRECCLTDFSRFKPC